MREKRRTVRYRDYGSQKPKIGTFLSRRLPLSIQSEDRIERGRSHSSPMLCLGTPVAELLPVG